jgi:hypothetical protein
MLLYKQFSIFCNVLGRITLHIKSGLIIYYNIRYRPDNNVSDPLLPPAGVLPQAPPS